MKFLDHYHKVYVICFLLSTILLVITCKQLEPFPEICIPNIPKEGNYCLWRINKRTDGFIKTEKYGTYSCTTGNNTARSTSELTLRIFPLNVPFCDESVPLIPYIPGQAGNTLSAKGNLIHREDSLAYFIGNFQIKNINIHNKEELLFKGTIELLFKIESHQVFGEAGCHRNCNQNNHVEGWLTGKGVGNLSKYVIRAAFASSVGDIPTDVDSFNSLFGVDGRISGVIIQAP